MKAIPVISLAACLVATAVAQKVPILGSALAVDIRTETIQWHPHGDALLYSRLEQNGVGIGLYKLDHPEGKILLHLGKSDKWSADWFEGSDSALVTVYRKIKDSQGERSEGDIYLLDGKKEISTEVFSKVSSDEIRIEADLSPSLTHAIFMVAEGKKSYHMVLPINGSHLVLSTDIDQAVSQGLSGPLWSVDGTALYGQGLGRSFTLNLFNALNNSGDAGGIKFTIDDGQSGTAVNLAGNFKVVLSGNPSPAIGTAVLEVVPSNGVLRQVRFRGDWTGQPEKPATLEAQKQASYLSFGQSRGSATSLWLMTGKEHPIGALVAAHADSGEISPEEKAIAYIVDGALFVRRIL